MVSNSSSYLLELRHQRRLLVAVGAVLVLFGAGVRFDRAILVDPSRVNEPGSAFAAVVPTPVTFPATRGQPVRIGRVPRRAVTGERGFVAPTGTLPATNDGVGVGGPLDGVAPGDAGPVTPTTSTVAPTQLAASEFGGGSGSIFGIPTGVIFGSAGGGTDPTAPGGGGSTPGIVPEPETWAFMILGVGMIGGMMRRRRSRADAGYGKAVGAIA